MRLRVVEDARFRVLYTTDGWATKTMLESHPVGYVGFFCDIPTDPGTPGRIELTIYWPADDRWLGHNLVVAVEAPQR
jgi:glucoamylase